MPSKKDIEDCLASRNILAANIGMFHQGNRDLYRVVAVELRKLVCDGKNSLIPRLFPSAGFHPLRGRLPDHLKEGLVFQMPAQIRFDGKGGSRIVALFNYRAEPLPLDAWLDQDLFNSTITIRELIRSVANKESAHSDKNYNDTLNFTRSVKLVDEEIHKQHIVAIGEYLLAMMTNTIKQYPKVFGHIDT